MTIGKAYAELNMSLSQIYDKQEGANISDWVFEHITGLKNIDRLLNKDEPIVTPLLLQLQNIKQRLMTNEPVQYVLEEAWFYKRKFTVNRSVLIPRPETEELVEWLLTDAKTLKLSRDKPLKILDIGTGSGCIAISIKKEMPDCIVTAIDISEEALNVARANAKSYNADIIFKRLDFLNDSHWEDLSVYDIIAINPPYIPISEKDVLSANVVNYEPSLALFVTDNDPYIFYKKVALFASTHLSSASRVYSEVHEKHAQHVANILYISNLNEILIKNDIYGKERMIRASKY